MRLAERVVDQPDHVVGLGEDHEGGEAERHHRHEPRRDARLGRQRPELSEEPVAIPHGRGDAVEDLGEVSAGLLLDHGGHGEDLEVAVRRGARAHLPDRSFERHPQPLLLEGARELHADGLGHLVGHQLEGRAERVSGPERSGHHVERLGQLLGEQPAAPFPRGEEQDRERRGERHAGDRQAGEQTDPEPRQCPDERAEEGEGAELHHRHPRVGLLEQVFHAPRPALAGEPGVERGDGGEPSLLEQVRVERQRSLVGLEAPPQLAASPVGEVAQRLEGRFEEPEEGEAGEDDEGGAHGDSLAPGPHQAGRVDPGALDPLHHLGADPGGPELAHDASGRVDPALVEDVESPA